MSYGGIVLKALLFARAPLVMHLFFFCQFASTLAGSASGGDASGMYSSGYSGGYASRGSDVSIFEISTPFLLPWFGFPDSFYFSIWAGWWEFIFITLLGP